MALTPGEQLRHKREEKNISLDQVARDTNIRVNFLQAIEDDRMGAISSQAQLRGFIRLYASYLGLNPQELFEPTPVVQPAPSASQVSLETNLEPDQPAEKPVEETPKINISARKKPLFAQKFEDKPTPEKKSDIIFREIGAELKSQRETLGLSRADIERQIKIRELYVYALEQGLIEDLPSSVQGRGMLNNYAAFMSLDPEPLQTRFAEGLQQRRIEMFEEETAKKKDPGLKKHSAPITGWRRYITPDLLIGGSVFIVLFVLIVWGAIQVIGSSRSQIQPTAESISSVLIGTDTPTAVTTQATPDTGLTTTPNTGDAASTASVDLQATINAGGSNPIQIVIVAYQRAYLNVISDGMEVFNGRIVPGGVYPFSGSTKIVITSGNASAMQVYYNQQDLGILGSKGQVISLEFSRESMLTSTPRVTAIPTATFMPTYTQEPTATPTVTITPVAPTITPYQP